MFSLQSAFYKHLIMKMFGLWLALFNILLAIWRVGSRALSAALLMNPAVWCSWNAGVERFHPGEGPCRPHEIQQGHLQGPLCGSGQSQAQIQAG